jgi:hypothetical protein
MHNYEEMKTVSNHPDLEWQITKGIVSQNLIAELDFDIEVIKWLDGKKNKAFNEMFLHPI